MLLICENVQKYQNTFSEFSKNSKNSKMSNLGGFIGSQKAPKIYKLSTYIWKQMIQAEYWNPCWHPCTDLFRTSFVFVVVDRLLAHFFNIKNDGAFGSILAAFSSLWLSFWLHAGPCWSTWLHSDALKRTLRPMTPKKTFGLFASLLLDFELFVNGSQQICISIWASF